LREKVKSALTYPKLVIVAAAGVVAFMLAFIVPAFSKVYSSFNKELPAVTKLLIAMSDVVTHYWWMVLIVIVVGIWSFKRYRATPKGKLVVDRMNLKIPVIGPVLRKIAIARFAETWAGATKGGIPILKALTISAQTAGNRVITDAVLGVMDKVESGSPVSPALDQTGEFPPLVTQMIAAGERAGSLDFMLDEIGIYYKRDVDYSVERLTKMLEPMMTIGVGGIVLFVLLALYMPVFNLTNVIKR
jgi:type IV pilus assembly protein PilC